MNKLLILAACLFLSACEKPVIVQTGYDNCQRERVFKECMASLPAGPVSTQYNDWDEVVDSCRNHAGNVSWKETELIKKECR